MGTNADPKPAPVAEWLNVHSTWPKQALADNLAWFKSQNGLTDKVKIEAYSAGFSQGWNECLQTLKLHGYLVTRGRVTSPYTGKVMGESNQ